MPNQGQSASDVATLAQGSNAFGFDLYQRLRREPGNLIISPVSITIALTMTWGGARGETAAQMRTVLHLEGTVNEVMAGLRPACPFTPGSFPSARLPHRQSTLRRARL
jgi:serine protease inhibitor